MVRYFTEAFYDELARRLNGDEEWRRKARGLALKLLINVTDLNQVHLVEVQEGLVTVRPTIPEEPADIKLEGPHEHWTKFATGESDLPTLVMTGRLRFKGSVSKIMGMQEALNRLAQVARAVGG